MRLPKYLQRQVEAAAMEALGGMVDRAIAQREEAAKVRTRRLNVMDTGVWIDMDAAEIRLLRGLRGALERRKRGKPARQGACDPDHTAP